MKCWFFRRGKTGVPGEKPLGARERTNNKLNPHMASTPGFEPRPHRWEASALTTAPPLPDTCLCRIFFSVSALFKFCQIYFVFLETTLTHTDRHFNRLIEGIAPLLRISLPPGVKNGTISIQQHRHCFFLSRGLNAVFKVRIWKP